MTEEEFRLIRDLIHSHCGIFFDTDAKFLLEKRLARRLDQHQLPGFKEYYHFLKYSRGKDQELSDIMDILTTNETYFFREEFQLNAFVGELLPELKAVKERRGDRTIRIWSAGCSTGEEPYTIAMLILETGALQRLENRDCRDRHQSQGTPACPKRTCTVNPHSERLHRNGAAGFSTSRTGSIG